MACFHPVRAFQLSSGEVVFSERGDVRRDLVLPCGRCIGCRLERSRQWALRCLHESKMHKVNSFLTVTYDSAHVPENYGLSVRDHQLFMARVRQEFRPNRFRFYMCGEYGEGGSRPHYHYVAFGLDFSDKRYLRKSGSGKLYTSEVLERLWGKGYCTIGDVTPQSIEYVTRYVLEKQIGEDADSRYNAIDFSTGEIIFRKSEFALMSRHPGIGGTFFDKFESDIFPHDHCIYKGKPVKPPRYYDLRYAQKHETDFKELQSARELRAYGHRDDATPERLKVREQVTYSRLDQGKRNYSK